MQDNSVTELGWVASVVCIDPTVAPECASNPVPANLATDIDNSGTTISWTASAGVVTGYDVFFGTDPLALTQVATNQAGTSYNAGDLTLNTTYFWQVIAQIKASGIATLIVDRDWRKVLQHSDRAIVLLKGEIVLEGTGIELLHHPNLSTYLGV